MRQTRTAIWTNQCLSSSTSFSHFIRFLIFIVTARDWKVCAFLTHQRQSFKDSPRIRLFPSHNLNHCPPRAMSHTSITDEYHNRQIPQHVAFICDGNSRWAQQHNCSTSQGHSKGADRLVDLLENLQADGVSYCTFFGFSTENWKRPTSEINEIFRVMELTARRLMPRLLQQSSSVHLRILGDLQDDRIPLGLRKILQELQIRTHRVPKTDKALTVCLAVNYGGRQDMLQATQRIATEVAAGRMNPDNITQDVIASYLTTAGIPDPDLIVRTSGEHRLSNFLLWNVAYSELYVTDVFWPDFDAACWQEALLWYQRRNRRFGSRTDNAEFATTPTSMEKATRNHMLS